MVEDVVKTLERSGELDNTYIFYSSDHGYHLGKKRISTLYLPLVYFYFLGPVVQNIVSLTS